MFEKALRSANFYMRVIGIPTDIRDGNRTLMERLRNRWFYCINFLWLNTDVAGEITWFVKGLLSGSSTLIENTYLIPCLTLCILGNVKTFFTIKYANHIIDLVAILKDLEIKNNAARKNETEIVKERLKFLTTSNKFLLFVIGTGIIAFGIGPLMLTASIYFSSGDMKLKLPFLIWYPFDSSDIRYWPFVYVHQVWSACIACCAVYGPDCFYFTSCTFIHIHFIHLQNDITNVIVESSRARRNGLYRGCHQAFLELTNRHKDLIRCVNLLEIIYSKSTLVNVVSSSLLICVTGFNVMAIDFLPLIAPFTSFLALGLVQTYLLCYYGDTIMCSSTEVSDAVYNSTWYGTNISQMRDYLFVMKRAQKPCKLTAYGFSDVNLRTFSRILSTAWSYFALLITIYRGNGQQ
uniref:Odorant receptor n=1 Tax=Bombyx mori TaxID=7091 RepID=C4B7V6_BOMMO|nr:olfactory receptor [Bombyx mori]